MRMRSSGCTPVFRAHLRFMSREYSDIVAKAPRHFAHRVTDRSFVPQGIERDAERHDLVYFRYASPVQTYYPS